MDLQWLKQPTEACQGRGRVTSHVKQLVVAWLTDCMIGPGRAVLGAKISDTLIQTRSTSSSLIILVYPPSGLAACGLTLPLQISAFVWAQRLLIALQTLCCWLLRQNKAHRDDILPSRLQILAKSRWTRCMQQAWCRYCNITNFLISEKPAIGRRVTSQGVAFVNDWASGLGTSCCWVQRSSWTPIIPVR